MKFNKLAKSDSFDYKMLDRLQQDCKYFIEHPDLKHLWTYDINAQIKKMLEIYTSLDPKPEWICEDKIYEYEKQMKESYKNYWNERHPDNKIKSSEQPTTPKPTEVLPTNMQWAWDPKANTWIAVMKDNPVVTPPTYNPNNIQNQNTTSYMSTIKSASEKNMMELAQNIIHDVVLIHKAKSMDSRTEWDGTFAIFTLNPEKTDVIDIKYIPQSSLPSYTPNDNEYGLVRTRDTGFDETDYQLQPLEMIIRQRKSDSFAKDDKNAIELGYKKQSSCLSKFLDGPQYSKEIKIEAGLIKEGLLKYAGFDFNRGSKYTITDKGLKFLKAHKEQELNEAQNEREKLAYLFGFNTDEVSTLDTTGKVIKNSKKWTICEADGTELGEVEADSELDAKVKFGIEHPEYADSLSICAKEIDAKYEETTNTKEPYPNPSETPHDDIILENHTGWVNTAGLKNKSVYRKLFILAKMLEDYHKKELIWPAESEDDNIEIVTGDAKAINELEHRIKDLGFYCESVLQSELPETGLIYSLKIFLDEE